MHVLLNSRKLRTRGRERTRRGNRSRAVRFSTPFKDDLFFPIAILRFGWNGDQGPIICPVGMSETGLTEVQQNGYLENTSPTSAIFTRHRRNLTIRFTKRPTPRCGLRRAVGHVTRCATGEKTSTNSRNPCALGNEKPADFIGNTGSELFGSRKPFFLQNDRFFVDFSVILLTIRIYFHGGRNGSEQVLTNGMGES